MYHSVLFEWLNKLNIKVPLPFMYTYCNTVITTKGLLDSSMVATAKNHILVENFTTFNVKLYREKGSAYIDSFKIKMKKLFLKSRDTLAKERVNLDLNLMYDSFGFVMNPRESYPFINTLMAEACIVQNFEYEEYIKLFLTEVEKQMKSDKDFEMEPGFPRYVFSSAQNLMMNRYYTFPQEIYMSLGRFALLLFHRKWEFDQKNGVKNEKKTDAEKKGKVTKK